ncbi:MAG TPA: hypothetical protein VFQ53_20960 [Kofleriaceae bacterium]|nr:hypothetical protein [Kofleriaceae bacterium]
MRFHVHHGGKRVTHQIAQSREIGTSSTADTPIAITPPWNARLVREPAGWTIELVAGSRPTRLGDRVLAPGIATPLLPGDVLRIDSTTISFVYEEPVLPAAPPLTAHERTLLAQLARDPDDDALRSVLGDEWEASLDPARGMFVQLHDKLPRREPYDLLARHGDAWRRGARIAGFPDRALELARGFVRDPLVVVAGEPLERHPELFRLSPRVVREDALLRDSLVMAVFDGRLLAADGEHERVVIKALIDPTQSAVPAAHAVFRHPHLPRYVGRAWRRDGFALVLAWAGHDLRRVLEHSIGDEPFAISIALQLCDTLAYLHDHGTGHGAVQPEHVLLAPDGNVTLIGGQVGHALFEHADLRARASDERHQYGLRYLAPAQVRGRRGDPSSDVHCLAMVVGAAATGRELFARDQSTYDLLMMLRDNTWPVPPLSPRLRAVVERALGRIAPGYDAWQQLHDDLAAAASAPIGPSVIAERIAGLQ